MKLKYRREDCVWCGIYGEVYICYCGVLWLLASYLLLLLYFFYFLFFIFFFDSRGVSGPAYAHHDYSPRPTGHPASPEQVRHRGGDRRAHRGSNPGGGAEQVHNGPQQLNPHVLGTHEGWNQDTQTVQSLPRPLSYKPPVYYYCIFC